MTYTDRYYATVISADITVFGEIDEDIIGTATYIGLRELVEQPVLVLRLRSESQDGLCL